MFNNPTKVPPEKCIVIGVEPNSLINFRGELIKAIKNRGVELFTVSSPLSSQLHNSFLNKGFKHKAVEFQRNGLNPLADLKTLSQLFCLFRRLKPGFVLAYTIKPVIWGGFAAQLLGIRFYALVTGLGFAFQGESYKRRLLTRLVSFLYKKSLAKAEAVIFQNEDNRQVFIQRSLVPSNKTYVVNGSGVDMISFSYKSLPVIDNGIIFLCIARLLGEKGVREFAKAASVVKIKNPKAKFVLIGPEDTSPDGIAFEEVQGWVNQGWIDYQGSTKDVRPYIEKAHVYVLPSYHEGLPRSTLEAMSMGRPVITTNAVGCKETVEQGVNGFIVSVKSVSELAEKMIWFIENPERIVHMGLESRRMVEEKFDVHKVNAKMLKIMGLE